MHLFNRVPEILYQRVRYPVFLKTSNYIAIKAFWKVSALSLNISFAMPLKENKQMDPADGSP